jgi:hypothetical protein
MKTDELIARLAADTAREPKFALARLLGMGLGAGAVAAFLFTLVALGLRHDLGHAAADWQYWAKFAYPLALALAGAALVERLARPGVAGGPRWLLVAIPLLAAVGFALAEWNLSPAEMHPVLMYGHSWLVCPFLIVMVSAPVAAGLVWSLKRLAPTRPVEAGAAAGLLSGAAGAWIYALHCNETSLVFVALWYTAGIALTALIGAAFGPRLLRW